jgi:hypothetical protein
MCCLSAGVKTCKLVLVSALMSYFSYTCGVHFDVLTLLFVPLLPLPIVQTC